MQFLYEEVGPEALKKAVRRPLTGHVLIPYYGCLLTRPANKAKFDDPENPVSMDRLLEATGALVPDFPYKTECCGATYGVTRNDFVGKLSGRILDMASRLGAEAIVVACPLCQQNLDLRQNQINKHYKSAFHLPVPYISQVIGLSLGMSIQKSWEWTNYASPQTSCSKIARGPTRRAQGPSAAAKPGLTNAGGPDAGRPSQPS